jgi:transposase
MGIRSEVREGVPIARVAQKYGVSRQSIYNLLRAPVEASGVVRARVSLLDAFKAFIRARLELYDLPATTLLRELREQGYQGGISILKDFAREVKQAAVKGVIERFETLPGHQAQIDWGECGTITVDGVSRRLYVFVFVLGYSRILFARFTTSMRQVELHACLQEAFATYGVPKQLLVDNMKQAVDRHHLGDGVRFNRGFLAFCEHYGTLPAACPPYWPRAKGKVEAGVKFIKNSFLLGRSFITLADLNAQLDAWLASFANVRVHATTLARPVDRYQVELPSLLSVSAIPVLDIRELLLRGVPSDSHVRVAAGAYSVPPAHVGSSVQVRARDLNLGSPIDIIAGGVVIARHTIAGKGARVTLPEHAELIRAAAAAARRPRKPKARYEQRSASEVSQAEAQEQVEQLKRDAPIVQQRSLQEVAA